MGADAGSDCPLAFEATGNIKGFKLLEPDGNLRILRCRLLYFESPSWCIGTPQVGTPIDEVDIKEVGLEEGPVRLVYEVEFLRSSNESEKLNRFEESGEILSTSEIGEWLCSMRFSSVGESS